MHAVLKQEFAKVPGPLLADVVAHRSGLGDGNSGERGAGSMEKTMGRRWPHRPTVSKRSLLAD